jgi:hypothetical protein
MNKMNRIKEFLSDPLNRFFVSTVLAVSAFKLWVMNMFPITCDEAYYWLWHKRLALSFVDHPPFIAYFNKFVSFFGEYNLFNFRLAGLILALLCTYFIYETGRTLFDRKVGIIAAILFQLVPHYIIIWLTVTIDNPLALFWILSLFFVAKITKEGKPLYWYLLGISFGLGMLSKYTMVFFVLPLFLFLLIDPAQRKWFKSFHPYLALLLSLLIFSPVIIWNAQHGFASLLFHSSRLGRSDFLQNLLSLIADQLVHFTPFLFLGLLIYSRQLWQKSKFLFLFSLPLLLIFAAFTALIKVWAHWVIVYQFAAIIGIAAMIMPDPRTVRRMLVSMWVFALIVVLAILFGSSMILPRQALYRRDLELPSKYAELPQNTYIIAPYHGIASQLAFYARRTTYMAQGELKVEERGFGLKQFELWGPPPLKKGDNIVYYGPPGEEAIKKLKKHFSYVKIKPELDIYVIESYLDDLVPYYCQGFRGKKVVL